MAAMNFVCSIFFLFYKAVVGDKVPGIGNCLLLQTGKNVELLFPV